MDVFSGWNFQIRMEEKNGSVIINETRKHREEKVIISRMCGMFSALNILKIDAKFNIKKVVE